MSFQLQIKNFQSIPDATIELGGFTAIVGPSNLGKSALVRALRAWAYNELHPSMIREHTKSCELTGVWSDDTPHDVKAISFLKSSTQNLYTVTFKDGTVKSYPKIGTDTPDELKKLRFELLQTEREDFYNLNFQGQLEPLFLVTDTPTTLTSFFNKIFGIAKYEAALRNINSDQIKFQREYDDLSLAEVRIKNSLDETNTDLGALLVRQSDFESLWREITATEARIERLGEAVEVATFRDTLIVDRDRLVGQREHFERIPPIVAGLVETVHRAYRSGQTLQQVQLLNARHGQFTRELAQYRPIAAAVAIYSEVLTPYLRRTQLSVRLTSLHRTQQATQKDHDQYAAVNEVARTLTSTLRGLQSRTAFATQYNTLTRQQRRAQTEHVFYSTASEVSKGLSQALSSVTLSGRLSQQVKQLHQTKDRLTQQHAGYEPILAPLAAMTPLLTRVLSAHQVSDRIEAIKARVGRGEALLAEAKDHVLQVAAYKESLYGSVHECPLCKQTLDPSALHLHSSTV